MPTKTSIKFDKKGTTLTVDDNSLLEEARKKYKQLLKINPMFVHVEIGFDAPPPKPDKIEDAVEKAAEQVAKEIDDELDKLVKKLEQLQKEEKAGSKKAATEAEKLVKAADKTFKNWPAEINIQFRKAAQKAVKDQTGKTQLSSVGRSGCRGMDLADGAFEGASEGGEYVPFFTELSKGLGGFGKDIAKKSLDEKKLRQELIDELVILKGKVEASPEYQKDKADFKMRDFVQKYQKEYRKMEDARKKYGELLTAFLDSLDKADAELKKLEKLARTEKELKADTETKRPVKAYRDGVDVIQKALPPRLKLLEALDRLPKEQYREGGSLASIKDELNSAKGVAKSGKAIEDAGKELESEAKEMKA